jgi:hypothetical protein
MSPMNANVFFRERCCPSRHESMKPRHVLGIVQVLCRSQVPAAAGSILPSRSCEAAFYGAINPTIEKV